MPTLRAPAPVVPGQNDLDIEPDEEWKQNVRERIDNGVEYMVERVNSEFEYEWREAPVEGSARERLGEEHSAAISEIRRHAVEQFQIELECERRERRWASGRDLPSMQTEGLMKEQQAILDGLGKRKGEHAKPKEKVRKGGTRRKEGEKGRREGVGGREEGLDRRPERAEARRGREERRRVEKDKQEKVREERKKVQRADQEEFRRHMLGNMPKSSR